MRLDRVQETLQNLQAEVVVVSIGSGPAQRDQKRAHLLVRLTSDRRCRLGAVPLPRRPMIDHRGRLRVLPATDPLKDRLLVDDKLAKAGTCDAKRCSFPSAPAREVWPKR